MTKGRPRKYATDAEYRDAKRQRDRERLAAKRLLATKPETIYEEIIPQCCLDWRKAGRANRRTCPQHKTWNAFIRYSRDFYRTSIRQGGFSTGQDLDTIIALFATNRGARVSADPDSWKPITREDKAQDKALAEWAAAREASAPVPDETVTTSHIPDDDTLWQEQCIARWQEQCVAYWQRHCAEGRRWHKSAAFLYPPEMNRGGDWVTQI